MADNNTFKCTVVTPEQMVIETDCKLAIFPAHDGLMGILQNHAPLIGRVGHGKLRLETTNGVKEYYIDGGFVQIKDNVLTILSDGADLIETLDDKKISADLERARSLPSLTDADHQRRQHDVEVALEKQQLIVRQ